MSSWLHINIAATTHLMLVFLSTGSPQYFLLKIIIIEEKRNLICQFLSQVMYKLSGLLPVQFCMFLCWKKKKHCPGRFVCSPPPFPMWPVVKIVYFRPDPSGSGILCMSTLPCLQEHGWMLFAWGVQLVMTPDTYTCCISSLRWWGTIMDI